MKLVARCLHGCGRVPLQDRWFRCPQRNEFGNALDGAELIEIINGDLNAKFLFERQKQVDEGSRVEQASFNQVGFDQWNSQMQSAAKKFQQRSFDRGPQHLWNLL